MTDYTKLVAALRYCEFGWSARTCDNCEYSKTDCQLLLSDAADAIEALQAEVKRLEPKRGEWIHSVSVQGTTSGGITYYHGYTCSVCGGLMGRKGDAYCYKCGANMEVQE